MLEPRPMQFEYTGQDSPVLMAAVWGNGAADASVIPTKKCNDPDRETRCGPVLEVQICCRSAA